MRLLRPIAMIVTSVCALLLIACAYAGCVNPRIFPLTSALVLAFPVVVVAMLAILVLDLLWWRRAAIVAAGALLICSGPILDVFPFHAHAEGEASEDETRFTLLTYNVGVLNDFSGQGDTDANRTIQYIIDTDADIVCLQEMPFTQAAGWVRFNSEQARTLRERYPYFLPNGDDDLLLLSKYEAHFIPLDNAMKEAGGYAAAYTLNIKGQRVCLFNVHLKSYELNDHDKQLYGQLTKLQDPDSTLSSARHELLSKIEIAGIDRAREADLLVQYIKNFGGENVILCGDFNDAPTCYTLRRLEDVGMHQVYPALGFGYMRTFNRDRFYFRIDHVLWRGNLRPLAISRGDIASSDHFPLLTTFAIPDIQNN